MPNIIRIPSPVNNSGTPQLYDIETDTAATGLSLTYLYKAITAINVDAYKAQIGSNTGSAFYGCEKLQSLDLRTWDVSTCYNVNYIFSGCTRLTSLKVSGWDVSHMTSFTRCFYNCSSLTELDLSGWNTAAATTMQTMFNYCTSLHKIWVPSTFVATNVTAEANKPFYHGTVNPTKTHVYTDATDATTQGWGTPNADFIMHYNATHADYENA